MYRTLNPSTEELIQAYDLSTNSEIETALNSAILAARSQRELGFKGRAERVFAIAGNLKNNLENYASLITLEMGKPIVQARAEITKCVETCEYYAKYTEQFLSPKELLGAKQRKAILTYEPHGPILAIMPWNYPFNQVFRFSVPAMMAGNVVVLKHAPNTPACAIAIEEVFKQAGFFPGAFQNLFLSNEQVAEVVSDKRIRGVTLTGSAKAGSAVGAVAGAQLKKMVFELGGSDPFIVLKDANLKSAAELAAKARCSNSGQVCCSSKRFLVPKSCLDEFKNSFIEELEKFRPSDPTKEDARLGPLAREDLRETLRDQVTRAVKAGASIVYAQKSEPRKGYYFSPMILEGGEKGSSLYTEELFGPVATIIPYTSEEEAINIANSSDYGLSAVVCSTDLSYAKSIASKLECGTVSINAAVSSDIALPFGGVKSSGFGRELGEEGVREFASTKIVTC